MQSHACFFIIENKGDPLSVIDNWGAFHKDKNDKWINDDNMKKKKDELREKLTEEALEGTPLDSLHVSLDDEFGIMVENLGRKGKSVNGVGIFPRTNTYGCGSSIASNGLLILQQENEQLKDRLDLPNGKTNNNYTKSNGDISEGENTYPELEEHDLEEDWFRYYVFCC
ncbi:unnamed protein product [Malus baccata var. baccata]